ncbi:MAG: radical SAM protein [Gammaproteobacteria bacterium]|nr:radical SAM protein [Gammaproteobacteria bacterium]NIN62581.1 radical SAM protein [Gammaproteobacteria bacterium]NIO62392.1 radical SAM protein [Gammaproteobacteria bacterium]NIT06410.1 radical SAM protein [Gammaproteobacteria bacterium]NIT41873.1 radical SAM protein [Gammaproteobacteria bacterium]
MAEYKSEHCMVCGAPLDYRAEGTGVTCSKCGQEEISAIVCPKGHYVCNTCHSIQPLTLLPELASNTISQAPEDILEELLALPNLPMHGPEHHAMSGLAMLLASERAGIKLPGNFIEECIRRSMQIPGGTCGYHGACGGAVSLGVAVSIITGATPLTGLARGMAHRATAMALLNCSDDEARCCKRSLRKTISTGREFFAEELGIEFPAPRGHQFCTDINRNKECAREHCAYFRRAGSANYQ